jgi:hypothetical protein
MMNGSVVPGGTWEDLMGTPAFPTVTATPDLIPTVTVPLTSQLVAPSASVTGDTLALFSNPTVQADPSIWAGLAGVLSASAAAASNVIRSVKSTPTTTTVKTAAGTVTTSTGTPSVLNTSQPYFWMLLVGVALLAVALVWKFAKH